MGDGVLSHQTPKTVLFGFLPTFAEKASELSLSEVLAKKSQDSWILCRYFEMHIQRLWFKNIWSIICDVSDRAYVYCFLNVQSNLILVIWFYNCSISVARKGCWIWFWNQEEHMLRPRSVSLLSKELASSSSAASVFFQESHQIRDWSHGMFRCRFIPASKELVFSSIAWEWKHLILFVS